MTKLEFQDELEKRLSGMKATDVKKALDYYSELIDDYSEDGLSVDEAVFEMGGLEKITEDVKSASEPMKENGFAKGLSGTARGFMYAFLGIGAFAGGITLISLFASALAFALSPVLAIAVAVAFWFKGIFLGGCFFIGAALALAGAAVLTTVGCIVATKYCRIFRRWLFKKGGGAK